MPVSNLLLGAVNFGQLNTEPYDIPTINNITQNVPDASTVALLPYSLSFKYNAFVSTFYSAGGLGMGVGKYGLKDPFSKASTFARRGSMYKGTTFRGLIGDTINTIGQWRSPIEFTTDVGKALGNVRLFQPNVGIPRAIGGFFADLGRVLHSSLSPGREQRTNRLARRTFSQAGMSEFIKDNPVGMVENFLLRSKDMSKLATLMDPSAVKALGGKKGLTARILENIQKSTTTGTDYWLKGGPGLTTGRFNQGTISLGELLTGTSRSGKVTGRVNILMEAFASGKGKKFVFKGSLSRKDAKIYNQVHEAVLKTLTDKSLNMDKFRVHAEIGGYSNLLKAEMDMATTNKFVIGGGKDIAKTLGRDISEFTTSVVTRLRRARMVKVAGATAMGVGISVAVAKHAFRGLTEVTARLGSTVKGMLRMEFGSGEVLQNAALATERQRAIQAIQGAQMNARYLMGNEAAIVH